MKWVKHGLILNVDKEYDWMYSHASIPIPYKLDESVLRIFFGPRDRNNKSHTTFIDVEIDNPKNILYKHDKPILSPGNLGCFDDNGVMPCSIVRYDGKIYLYYIGWNLGVTVAFRNAIGLAISKDDGLTFKRISEGPIIDRSPLEPYFTASPFVIHEKNIWKIWYLSGTGWKEKEKPLYNIRYANSLNGINWNRTGHVCIDYKSKDEECISRPFVLKENGIYKMWYSYRGRNYRIGYAESKEGLIWERKDEEVGINISNKGWDSEMIEYCSIFVHQNRKYMFYNGNGFGKSGFGYAICVE